MASRTPRFFGTLATLVGLAAAIPLRDDMGNMTMSIDTPSSVAQSYFNQGLRFTAAFKFDYAAESHTAALRADPSCAMCEWGLALAFGQNLNDALVMALEPWFLDNEPLAYQAVRRAQALLAEGGGGGDGETDSRTTTTSSATGLPGGAPDAAGSETVTASTASQPNAAVAAAASRRRDEALVSALTLKFVPTAEEYESYFVDGLPASLNRAYAEAMDAAAARSSEEGWPDHPIVLLLAADAWMNLSPWNYWEGPHEMRPNARKARSLLEDALARDPNNPWAIHLFTHLMEAGAEAGAAVMPAKRLQRLVPGAPHLQHMQSHVEFRTGEWHEASEANLRAVALPGSDAVYPDHNMDMLMWALGVEGRRTESRAIGARLTTYSLPRVEAGVREPLLPPERFLAQEALHLGAFADWEDVLALDAPPEGADFPTAVFHFVRSLAFADAKDWKKFRQEQALITADVESMDARPYYYGIYNASGLTNILDLLSRTEGLRCGIPSSADGADPTASSSPPAAGREELELLRQAVELEDALGYDEPPRLPVPTRLFLASALLRGNVVSGEVGVGGGGNDGSVLLTPAAAIATTTTTAAVVSAVEEAETVLREVESAYPNMGRTLLGLWRCCSALGKRDDALEFRERFVSSWRYSEVWLKDSAHVGGRRTGGGGGGGGGGGTDLAAVTSSDSLGRDGYDGSFHRGSENGPESVEREEGATGDQEDGKMTGLAAAIVFATAALAAVVAAVWLVAALLVAAGRMMRGREANINDITGSGGFPGRAWWDRRRLAEGADKEETTMIMAQGRA